MPAGHGGGGVDMQIWQTCVGLWSINRTNMEAETWRAGVRGHWSRCCASNLHTVNIDTSGEISQILPELLF